MSNYLIKDFLQQVALANSEPDSLATRAAELMQTIAADEARDNEKHESLKETGRNAYSALVEMVAALECDYDRLQELKTECEESAFAPAEWAEEYPDDAEELKELESAAGECESREDAETRIHEDALSVEVRSDWYCPGGDGDSGKPTEFKILLSTGGPAVRIMGELSEHGEPDRAWLEVQDWGTPWTQYFDADQDTLLTYARCFYFGE